MASRGGRRFRTASTWGISIAVALAVVGFIGAMQWNSSLARDQFTTSAQQVLAGQVTDLEAEQDMLRQQIATANAQVQHLQQQSTGSSVALEEVNRQLTDARLKTGLMAVRGPGVTVEIADSKRVVPPGENPSSFIVLVDDLRDIVTALWASGRRGDLDQRGAAGGHLLDLRRGRIGPGQHRLPVAAVPDRGDRQRRACWSGSSPIPPSSAAWPSASTSSGWSSPRRSPTELTLPAFIGSTRFRWAVPSEEAP